MKRKEWWEGLPTDKASEWWEGLPVDEPQLTRIELSHPALAGGKLSLIRQGNRWSVGGIRFPNGIQSEGLQALAVSNLTVEDFKAPVPRLIETGGRTRVDYCSRCLSEVIPGFPHSCLGDFGN